MKICTYNVNSIRARKDLVLQWLAQSNREIDVLCLQELKVTDDLFPVQDFEAQGYTCESYGQKSYNGVALCARRALRQVIKGFGDSTWDEQKRLIGARVDDLSILNLYAPHGDERGEAKFLYKLDWYAHLLSWLEENFSPRDPLLLVGDLNVAHSGQDVYSAEALRDTIGTMPEEREAFSKLLAWGFTDVFRHLHPTTRQFTWWSYMGGAFWKDEGMRIDYALCTPPLLSRIKEIRVDLWPRKRRSPTPSDHAPLIITLDKPATEEDHE